MNEVFFQNELKDFILNKFANFEEYQDKFYLKKKIQEILPDKTDNEVYNAIEFANSNLKPPINKMDYIKALIEKLNTK